MKNINKT